MALRKTSHDSDWQPKYLTIITVLFCVLYIISLMLMTKLFAVKGLVLGAGIIVFPLCTILGDILTEVYGFNRARQAIWTALACAILYTIFTQLAIQLPPTASWRFQEAFDGLYKSTVRLALAGYLAWVVGQFVNSYSMSYLKTRRPNLHIAARFIGSTAVSQLLDTLIFFLVAFAGVLGWSNLLIALLTTWVARILYETLVLPLSLMVVSILKQLEGVDHFDRQKLKFI